MTALPSRPAAIAAGLALVAGLAFLLEVSRSGQPATVGAPAPKKTRVSRPLFSPAYAEALRDILDLEPADVDKLETRLARDPDDYEARLKLMAYHLRVDRAGLPESRSRRAELMLWLVEHRPDSEILASGQAQFQPGELMPEQEQRALSLWQVATETRRSEARVMWNAAQFYRQRSRWLYRECLEAAVALEPENEHYSFQLGILYAGAILTALPNSVYRDPTAADPQLAHRAREQLEQTRNAPLLAAAVRLLQSEYNRSRMMGADNALAGELARRYFAKLKSLDPEVDETLVFPRLEPEMIGMLAPGAGPRGDTQPRLQVAAGEILRLPVAAFPELPPAIASVLRQRGCSVPQTQPEGPPHNVARGEFFEKGQTGWAVLCSAGGFSAILVFRHDADVGPLELARSEDKGWLQGSGDGRIGFSRRISAVGREFILRHYRAYGGPEPPPIDHHGIDDAFLGKASLTHYWYAGQWLRLQGAD